MKMRDWTELKDNEKRMLVGIAGSFGPTPDNLLPEDLAQMCAFELFTLSAKILEGRYLPKEEA